MLYTLAVIKRAYYIHTTKLSYTRARGRRRRGTLSTMASFIVDSCRDQRFSLETWEWRRTIAWGRYTPLTIVDQFGSCFTPSFEVLGRLLKKKKKKEEEYDEVVWRSAGRFAASYKAYASHGRYVPCPIPI